MATPEQIENPTDTHLVTQKRKNVGAQLAEINLRKCWVSRIHCMWGTNGTSGDSYNSYRQCTLLESKCLSTGRNFLYKYLDTIRNHNVRDLEHFSKVTLHHTPSQSFLPSPTGISFIEITFPLFSLLRVDMGKWDFFATKTPQFIDMSMTRI